MTENTQHVPAGADHGPDEPTEAAKLLHGDHARGEVFDQPEAVELQPGTLIATEPVTSDELPDETAKR